MLEEVVKQRITEECIECFDTIFPRFGAQLACEYQMDEREVDLLLAAELLECTLYMLSGILADHDEDHEHVSHRVRALKHECITTIYHARQDRSGGL